MDAGSNGDVPADVSSNKAALEVQKLQAEVAELRKPWYLKPAVLQPIAAIVLGVLALITGYANGWFSSHLESLQNQQAKAEISLREMNDRRSALDSEIAGLTAQRDDLASQLKQARELSEALQQQYESASEKAREGERWHKDILRTSAQLDTALKKLASFQPAQGKTALWRPGDVITIRVLTESGAVPPEAMVNYPLDARELEQINLSKFDRIPGPVFVSACTPAENQDGLCQYTVGRAAMALGYVRVGAASVSLEPVFTTIPSGTRQVTLILKTPHVDGIR